jgi:hypothetical protein
MATRMKIKNTSKRSPINVPTNKLIEELKSPDPLPRKDAAIELDIELIEQQLILCSEL